MSKKMVWLIVGLLLAALVSSTALAAPSKGKNWQSIGERLAGGSVTLGELFLALGKPVSALPSQALDAQVHIGPVHKYVVDKKAEESTQNETYNSTESVDFVIWSWIGSWSGTVPTYVDYGTVVEASRTIMYMSVTATLTDPGGAKVNEYGSGVFTDEVDASGERWVSEPGWYSSQGLFSYFDVTLYPPIGGGYSWPAHVYLSP